PAHSADIRLGRDLPIGTTEVSARRANRRPMHRGTVRSSPGDYSKFDENTDFLGPWPLRWWNQIDATPRALDDRRLGHRARREAVLPLPDRPEGMDPAPAVVAVRIRPARMAHQPATGHRG